MKTLIIALLLAASAWCGCYDLTQTVCASGCDHTTLVECEDFLDDSAAVAKSKACLLKDETFSNVTVSGWTGATREHNFNIDRWTSDGECATADFENGPIIDVNGSTGILFNNGANSRYTTVRNIRFNFATANLGMDTRGDSLLVQNVMFDTRGVNTLAVTFGAGSPLGSVFENIIAIGDSTLSTQPAFSMGGSSFASTFINCLAHNFNTGFLNLKSVNSISRKKDGASGDDFSGLLTGSKNNVSSDATATGGTGNLINQTYSDFGWTDPSSQDYTIGANSVLAGAGDAASCPATDAVGVAIVDCQIGPYTFTINATESSSACITGPLGRMGLAPKCIGR